MSVDPLRFLEDAATAQAADAIKLRPLMLELSGSKVLAKECDIEHLLNAGFTVDDVEKLSKSLKPLIDQGVFDDAWTMAKGSGIILSAQEMTFPDLFMFRRWLTTPQGAQALSLVQARRKMTKAGKKVLGHQDVALLRLLQHYEDDARRELDAKRVETEAAVAQLQAEIDKLKKKYAKAEKKQKRDFPLIANYVPLTDNEVRNQAWDMYCQQCINEGSVPMGRTSTNLKIVGDKFRDHIVQAHKLTYCQQPDHTDALIEFGKQKILRCQEAGSGKLESSFRNLLTVLNPENAATLPPRTEEADDGVDTDGGSPNPPEPDTHADAEPAADQPTPPEATGPGSSAGPTPPQSSRSHKRKQPAVDAQSEDPNPSKKRSTRAGRHPNRAE
ncbi:TPA_inf: ORF1p [Festuca pratensis amalgavirus 2]|uniref:ORF1p n=1 Tax=Festuca pratensis amalgavirus 2 TaxID=2069325 RepID=UPI000DC1F461|nr:ORF1p [Festuca pratensis amalgavirus 2]DAB41688.1 TPA_inf: ORF1p [Festuca pratensis amalgavirus 2]